MYCTGYIWKRSGSCSWERFHKFFFLAPASYKKGLAPGYWYTFLGVFTGYGSRLLGDAFMNLFYQLWLPLTGHGSRLRLSNTDYNRVMLYCVASTKCNDHKIIDLSKDYNLFIIHLLPTNFYFKEKKIDYF